MPYKRKTVDCWRFYVDYGNGWEYETTEYTRESANINRKAYLKNCPYPLKVVKGREPINSQNSKFFKAY